MNPSTARQKFHAAIALFLFLVCFVAPGCSQTVIFGNSEVAFAPWQYSGIPGVVARGHLSLTCQQLQPWLKGDVPIGTKKVALVLATNDVRTGVPPPQHMACVLSSIAWLQLNRPGIKIVLANTPPWGADPPPGCSAPAWIPKLVEHYNQLYAILPYLPTLRGVKVADVWSGITQEDGWAVNPPYMVGPCYIHPDQSQQWPSEGWAFFMGQIAEALQ